MSIQTKTDQISLQRTVLIGIGGTGRDSILHTKERLMEIYGTKNSGKIPNLFSFVVIDTEYPKVDDIKVKLEPNEFIYAKVENVDSLIENQQHIKDMLPEEILGKARILSEGAGQIRGLGRIALFANYYEIKSAIENAIKSVRNWAIDDLNNQFKAMNDNVNIHLVFSTSGGTGSGMFLDIAYMLKKPIVREGDKIYAYVLMPEIFTGLPGTENVQPNCYGAFKELDHFMNVGEKSAISVNYGNGEVVNFNKAPFNYIYLINSVNKEGAVYREIQDLTKFIGNALFLQAGSIGKDAQSIWDNITKQIANKIDHGKSQIYLSFGISELYYDSKKLTDLASFKIAHNLINKYLNISGSHDISLEANAYILSNNLKEDDNRDDVIDNLLPVRTFSPGNPTFNENAPQEIEGIKATFLVNVEKESNSTAVNNYNELCGKNSNGLNDYLNNKLKQEGGIDFCKKFLNSLSAKLTAYKKMMEDELNELHINFNGLNKNLLNAKEDIANSTKGINPFGKESRIKSKCDNYNNILRNVGKIIQEIVRREYAVKFFTFMVDIINNRAKEIEQLDKELNKINGELISEIEILRTSRKDPRPFIIYLSNDLLDKIQDGNSIWSDLERYLTTRGKPMHLLSSQANSTEEIKEEILNFAYDTEEAKIYTKLNVEEAFDTLPDHIKEAIIDNLNKKAVPLWQYDKGIVQKTEEMFIIGVPSEDRSKIKVNYKDKIKATKGITFTTTNDPNRILFFKTEISAPAYSVYDFKRYRSEYDQRNRDSKESKASEISFHAGIGWEEFEDIFPAARDEKLELWTKAVALKLIKLDKGIYYIMSLDQFNDIKYKVLTDKNNENARREAFDIFVKYDCEDFLNNQIELIPEKEQIKKYQDHFDFIKKIIKESDQNISKIVISLLEKEAVIIKKEIDKLLREV